MKHEIKIVVYENEEAEVYEISCKELNCHFPVKKSDEALKRGLSEICEEWIDSSFGDHLLPL